MYKQFDVLSIEAIAGTKEIIITTNKDIDENNYENIVINIFQRTNKSPVLFDYEIKNEVLKITLKDWPTPNLDYILGIEGIKSITNDELSSIKRRIRFDSNVTSQVKIISPAMFEEVKSLTVELKETADKEEDIINSYYIEIAKDNAFYDLVNKTTINKNEVTLYLKENGQYFIRARVQADENNYSEWAPMISFIYGHKNITEPVEEDNHDDDCIDTEFDDGPEIELEDPLKITEYPEQGITPEESFLFVFNNKINDLSLDDIIITRTDVR